jgi:hypothetical protein
MPKSQHNGENFHYIVKYNPLDSRQPEIAVNITNPNQSELVIGRQPTYKRYTVRVQAANSLGMAPSLMSDTIVGQSGEDGWFILHMCFCLLSLQSVT